MAAAAILPGESVLDVGCGRDELKAILSQVAIYCGVPVAVECHRIAKRVFAELDGQG
ncbi:MAG: hypothetical protein OEU09_01620 [Rhodospirillales bacterium]|nr:hypothetical protein [Rhodospirillales bacterium]MDH3790892.1 hypothetical protein [Rhodospirillales bacterium]MDH3909963.1 hypothetical protein [Rhodospirillales bacterium]MDH3916759.1 hypothetical protein [Rhodospirillales bacterium]MDH3969097.1 hypothetical protein [Rhodospirillales bacterium]